MKYDLVNAEEHHVRFPETFWLPHETARSRVQPGKYVKLIFTNPGVAATNPVGPTHERMWVRVESQEYPHYTGELYNDPVVVTGLKFMEKISFEPKHIIQVVNFDDV